MSVSNGTLMRVYIGGAVINCEVTSTFESSFSTDKVACKDTPNGELTPGPIDFSISGEALVELAGAGNSVVTLMGIHIAKTEVAASYIDTSPGGFTISAPTTRLTNMSITGGTEESGRFSFTLTGSGDYTIS